MHGHLKCKLLFKIPFNLKTNLIIFLFRVILTYATPYHADSAKEPETVHHLHSLISKRRVQREALPVHSIRI